MEVLSGKNKGHFKLTLNNVNDRVLLITSKTNCTYLGMCQLSQQQQTLQWKRKVIIFQA